ncbi:MAG: hypothetical protein QG635_1625 [Bacteroidota bacterium]|nr:hypothetical protein [Bacteroidota bacterium]
MSVLNDILGTKELVALPGVASGLLEMLKSDDFDVRDIANVIESDAALTTKVLRVANSPLYASRGRISSVQQAIMLMGFSKLTNIVLGISIFSKFWLSANPNAKDLVKKFWWHSSSTGTIAKSVTSKIKMNYRDNEFIGGLLHQIGKLAMIQYDLNKYSKVISEIKNNKLADMEAEKRIFGISHVEVGESLARLWSLPETITTVIANYPHPSKLTEHRELVASVSFAGILSELNGADFFKGLNVNLMLTEQDSWQVLCDASEELRDIGIEFITEDIENELKKSMGFLNAISE